MPSPSELSLALAAFEWNRAIQIIRMNPSLASRASTRFGFFEGRKDSTVLPIHEACCGDAPVELIVELLRAFPAAISKTESCYQRLVCIWECVCSS